MDVSASQPDRTRADIIKIFCLFLLCWTIGTFFYHIVEDLSFLNAIYFAAMTLTTVGYGDFIPQTVAGKIFTIFYAFGGVGLFFGFASIIFNGTMQRVVRQRMSLHGLALKHRVSKEDQ